MDVVLARHGRTSWNAEGRLQGHGDPALDEVGEAQADALAIELAVLTPVWIATSDLRRARDTAGKVASACGLPGVITDPLLREVDLGSWEGLTRAEIESRHPVEWKRWRRGEDVRRGGGETRAEAAERFCAALLRHLAVASGDGLGVVVAHGIVIQAALDLMVRTGVMVSPRFAEGAPHLPNGGWLSVRIEQRAPYKSAGI